MEKIQCVDSHTGGEPTRLVLAGFPDVAGLPLADAVHRLRTRHDHYRKATVCEPRGHDVLVGALLLPPVNPGSLASVVFFNNVGYLGMCGHGTIGLMATLEYLGRAGPGSYAIDTPVGTVQARLHGAGRVSVDNVAAYRHLSGVALDVPGHGRVVGDVAWGGNWFFLVSDHSLALTKANIPRLTQEMFDQGKHYPQMNGKQVFRWATEKMPEVAHEVLRIADHMVLLERGQVVGAGAPATLAGRAFTQAVYGSHPYGYEMTEETLARITLADMRAQQARLIAVRRELLLGRLAQADRLLNTLSHQAILARGFALVMDADGNLLRRAAEQLSLG